MALRFKAEFTSSDSVDYEIEIWDSSHVGGATTFYVDSKGFDLRYAAEAQERHSPIVTSECSFTFWVQDATHEQFITDLSGAAEGRFTVKITTDNGANLYWAGIILADIAKYEDAPFPYGFEVRATDGLATLKDVEYKDGSSSYTGTARLISHVLNALNKLPYVSTHWHASNDVFLRSSVDWWETSMLNAINNDPIYISGVDHAVFWKFDNDAKLTYQSAYEVLKQILTTFGCRIMQIGGGFWIEQISYRSSANYYARTYSRNGTVKTTETLTGKNTVDQSSIAKLAGGTYDWFPALNEVNVTFNTFNRRNYLAGVAVDEGMTVTAIDIAVDSNSGEAQYKFTGTFSITITNQSYSGNLNQGLMWIFGMRADIGTHRAKRETSVNNFQIQYLQNTFVTTSDNVYVEFGFVLKPLPAVGESVTFTNIPISYTSPKIPGDASGISFIFQLLEIRRYNNSGVDPLDFEYSWKVNDPWLELYTFGNPNLNEDSILYTATNPTSNNTRKYEVETLLGSTDNPNTVGRIQVWNGSAWQIAQDWGAGTDTRDKKLGDLLARTILHGQLAPTKRMYGRVFGDVVKRKLYNYQSIDWLMLGGTWVANVDEIEGEWFEVDYGDGGISTTPVKLIKKGPFIPVLNGGSTPSTNGATGDYGFVINPAAPTPTVLAPVKSASTGDDIASGAVTSIPVDTALTAGEFQDGDFITIVDPVSGNYDTVEVTTTSAALDTAIAVTGTLTFEYPEGAYIIKKPGSVSNSLPSGTAGRILRHDGTGWKSYAGVTDGHVLTWDSTNGWQAEAAPGAGSGTVTSVGLSLPAMFSVSGSPVTTSGTLTATLANQSLNTVFAGPSVGGAAAPTFRALVANDIPNISAAKITTGTLAVGQGGTGLNAVGSSLQVLRTNAGGTALEYFNLTFPGSITLDLASQNYVFAGPASGGAGAPAYRALVADDIPDISTTKLTSGTLGVARGGTGLSALGSGLQLLRVNAGATALEYFTPSYLSAPGTAATGRVPYFDSTTSIAGTDNLYWDNTNKRLAIGGDTTPAGHLDITGTFSGNVDAINCVYDTQGGNLNFTFRNTSNLSGANTILNLVVGGSSASDPMVQFSTTGVTTWSMGTDTSDNSTLKIKNASTPSSGSNVGMSVYYTGSTHRVGLNDDSPSVSLDLASNTDSVALPAGNTAARPSVNHSVRSSTETGGLEYRYNGAWYRLSSNLSPTISAGAAAGTGPTVSITGYDLAGEINLTTGTGPTTGTLCTVTFNKALDAGLFTFVIFSARNSQTATDIGKIYVSSTGNTSFVLSVNAALSASTAYVIAYHVRQG